MKDPRRAHRRLHLLPDLTVIALGAVIAGAPDGQAIETFGRKRRAWRKRSRKLPHGIPAHDTLERVFARLAPRAFPAWLREWVQAVPEARAIKHVAIDGKTWRGSGSAKLGPLHWVSAGATAQRLALGPVAVDAKSNAITALPALRDLLDLHGALVTIDARGCPKAIAQEIIDQGGNCIWTVKDNQDHLRTAIQPALRDACANDFARLEHDTYATRERGHGREAYRR